MDLAHIIPEDDLIEHDTNGDCICGPEIILGEAFMISLHHSLDGRELHEQQERLI